MSSVVAGAPLRLGVALDGEGAHPAAWDEAGSAAAVTSAERLVGLARLAERGGLDFVALDDALDPLPDAPGAPTARLDALLALARVAPATNSIGLVPTVTTTHTEPFHVSKNLATLDLVSDGRAGWRVAVSASDEAAAAFGRKPAQPRDVLLAEAEDAIEVVRRLWDSWEDDAVIRDQATGRYLDRDRVHYIDFEGPFFNVRGPSITPRSPQAQPLVVVDAVDERSRQLAARRADLVVVPAADEATARAARADLRQRVAAAGRPPDQVAVLVLATVGEPALRRHLDARAPRPADGVLDLCADAAQVAEVLSGWHARGAADGFLLRPDLLPDTLDWLVEHVVPRLGRPEPATGTLRDRFGLPRPANRYAADPEVRR